METLPFHPVDPGIRTLWIIRFNEKSELAVKHSVDFFIPSPFKRNDWISTEKQSREKALDILSEINRTCSDIKNKCQDIGMMKSFDDYLKRAKGVFNQLEDLDALVKNFDDTLKDLSPPPSKNPEAEEESPEEEK